MERPRSIIWFERLFLAAMLFGLMNSANNWPRIRAQMAAVPNGGVLPDWFLPVMTAIGIGINLLLWYFIARRRSVVAKWILTVLMAFGAFGMLGMYQNVQRGVMAPDTAVLSALLFLLQIVAVIFLFRPDARLWFDRKSSNLGDTFS